MMSPQLTSRIVPAHGFVRFDPALFTSIRQNIIARTERNRAIERVAPAAIDATAAKLALLHARLGAHLIDVAGPTPPAFFVDQLHGRRSMTWEDEARLCLQAPDAMADAMEPGLRLAQRTVMLLLSSSGGSLSKALAAASEAMGLLQECGFRVLEDGVVEPHEKEELLRTLCPLLHALHSVRAIAAERDR
jgi:hypothetical protein